jgi:sugar lactone lactonase YvrE
MSTLAGSSGNPGSANGTGDGANFNSPGGVAVDASGNVYVADSGNNLIRKISPAGVVTTLAGSGLVGSDDGAGSVAKFNYPQGIALDRSGNVYVADRDNHRIRKITPTGLVTTLAGGNSGTLSFNFPSRLTVDFGGTVYVANGRSKNVKSISPGGVVTTKSRQISFGEQVYLGNLDGIALDTAGNIYLSDDTQRIYKFNPEGYLTVLAGSSFGGFADGAGTAASFNRPAGMSIDGSGNLYVADSLNHKIRRVTTAGVVTSFLGSGLIGANDGTAAAARFNSPADVAIDATGNLYIADQLNHTIRKATAPVTQIIDFPFITDKAYGDPGFPLGASSNSGLPVTYTIVSGPAALSGGFITLTGVGIVTVRVSQPGAPGYLPAVSVTRTFNVVKGSQTLQLVGPHSRPIGIQPIPISVTASSGLSVSLTLVSGQASLSGNAISPSGPGSVVIKASQPGSAFFMPAADLIIPLSITLNTSSPISLETSRTYFYDNSAVGSQITQLSSIDPDIGDILTYTLVNGAGDSDNSKFLIVGNHLNLRVATNYNTQKQVSIRVRITDSAGQSYEQILVLQVLPASPNAVFIPAGIPFTREPNYVNAIFQLVGKDTGRGLNYPRTFFDPGNPDYQPNLFQAFEGATLTSPTSPIAYNESYFQIGKISDVPSKVRTVLLLDCSSSISIADLALIKTAAKGMVDKMFKEQEIAIYSFSGSATQIQGFLGKSDVNQMTLKAAIDTIARGSATTNLYGSMLQMLSLPAWKESFTKDGIETGFLVVMTDGVDSSGSATKEQVKDKRDDVANQGREVRRIYTIGLGAGIDSAVLDDLENMNFYRPVSQAGTLAAAFDDIQKDIIDLANSFYQFNYISPKRGAFPPDTPRRLEVKLRNNINLSLNGTLRSEFNSEGFTDLAPAIYINRTVFDLTGISSPKPLAIKNRNLPETAYGITLFPPLDFSSFTWSIGNPALASLTPQGAIGERVVITPSGLDGTTTLTLTDTISNFTKTIPLIIGTGVPLTPQTIIFSALADRVPSSPAFTLSASASSSLPVVFTIVSGPATLTGNTVFLTGASGTVTVRATEPGDASFAAAPPQDRSFTVANSDVLLTKWATSAGLSGASVSPTATPFNDGVNNLLKYAFNMNASGPDMRVMTESGVAGLPQVILDTSGAQPKLKVQFLRRKNSGLNYTPQRSSNLGGFVAMSGIQTVESIDSQWDRVSTVESFGPSTRSFARVQVSLP